MSVIRAQNCIQCTFLDDVYRTASFPLNKVEVYFGITKNLENNIDKLENYLSIDERKRSEKFYFIDDRNTYILVHGLLRLILSKILKKDPKELIFYYEKNNKPGLVGDPLFFNLTHTREAFAFAVSQYFYCGIDMESIKRNIEPNNIIEMVFSSNERKYLLKSSSKFQKRFFKLWTRKEAFLKAIGIGLVENLANIELLNNRNEISNDLWGEDICHSLYKDHYIYTAFIFDCMLSIAIPNKADINLTKIDEKFLLSYFDIPQNTKTRK